MTMRLIHPRGLALVEQWEGLYLIAYRDITGLWTIGWGHTGGVFKGQVITRMQAEQFLTVDLAAAAGEVQARAPQSTDDQFDAMVSFTFNCGIYAFRSSTLLRKYKAGDILGAADQFLVWDKAHVDGQLVVVQGLLNRRRAERSLFLGMVHPAGLSEVHEYYQGRLGIAMAHLQDEIKEPEATNPRDGAASRFPDA